MNKSKRVLIFILILIIGFILRVFLTTCYFWDEVVYLQHAEIFHGKVNNYNEFSIRPLFISILFSLSFYIWHNSLSANFLVVALSILSIVVIFLTTKEFFKENDELALVSAFLLAFWPIHIFFSKTLLVHTTAVLFSSLFLFFQKKAESTDKEILSYVFSFLCGMFIGVSILSRFTYLVLIPIAFFNVVLFRNKYNFRKIVALLLGFILVMFPYLLWCYRSYGSFFYTFREAQNIVRAAAPTHPWYFYLMVFPVFLGPAGLVGFVFWLFIKIKERRIRKKECLLLSWIVLPLLYLTTIPHKETRYLFVAFVPILLLSSTGLLNFLSKIKSRKFKISIILFLILSSVCFSFFYKPFTRICNHDAKAVAEDWIMNNTNKSAVIYTHDYFPYLGYYSNRTIIVAPFNKEVFFDKNSLYMKIPGYYLYFEDQEKRNPVVPSRAEIEKDPRFKLVNIFQNRKKIYIYAYNPGSKFVSTKSSVK